MEKKKKSCLGSCLGVVGGALGFLMVALISLVLGYFVLRAAGAFLIISDDLVLSDAIVIMGGGGEARMNEALEIFRDKYARVIILTETGEQAGEYEHLQSFDLQIQLLSHGVPGGNILITDDVVGSTLDEAKAVKTMLERRQFSSAIIVTDPYHTKRTSIIFRDVFEGSDKMLTFRPVSPSWYTSRTWFLSADGWRFTMLEYFKLIGYFIGLQE